MRADRRGFECVTAELVITPRQARPVQPDPQGLDVRSYRCHIRGKVRHGLDPPVVLGDGGGNISLPSVTEEEEVIGRTRPGLLQDTYTHAPLDALPGCCPSSGSSRRTAQPG